MPVEIRTGDCRGLLMAMPADSVDCVVTSPPYWGLRDYGVAGQIGLEPTPEDYVVGMVAVFEEVRRVLRPEGTCWVNLGDTYASRPNGSIGKESSLEGSFTSHTEYRRAHALRSSTLPLGYKHKDLIGIPWMVAFALRAAGWYLRRDIIWHKTTAMPESVKDRPTGAHEYVFLLTKSGRYFYDADAVKEPVTGGAHRRKPGPNSLQRVDRVPRARKPAVTPKSADPRSRIKANESFHAAGGDLVDMRNLRSVWSIAGHPYSEAHFATFPPDLVEPCIKAGCPRGGVVLDPFGGAGTTGLVADRLGRNAILIELNPEYAAMAERRIKADGRLFAEVSAA